MRIIIVAAVLLAALAGVLILALCVAAAKADQAVKRFLEDEYYG